MIRVMIIEDDPMVRDINSMFLDKLEGFKLLASTGDIGEAKEIIIKDMPQLILLDIFLPKGNGIELLKWLRREEIKCDVILITADRSIEAVEEAFRYGAIDYLIKPFTFQRFKEALNQYKCRLEGMNTMKSVQQKEIDRFILNSNESLKEEEEMELSKGLNQHTYVQVWEHIGGVEGNFTADQIAEDIGLARVTVRRYLEFMLKEDKLTIEFEYGKVGRPCHMYKKKK